MIPFATTRRGRLVLLIAVSALIAPASADESPKTASPYVRLLESGRIPEERQGTVIEMIGKRGVAADLGYLFERATGTDGFSAPIRLQALNALADAARTRQARPEGDLSALALLIRPEDPKAVDLDTRRAAIRLAGLWKVESLGEALRAIALNTDASSSLRSAALDALAEIGGDATRAGIETLLAEDRPWDVRSLAVAALARLDLQAAASRAVAVIQRSPEGADLTPPIAAFLNQRGGADVLARAINESDLSADAAKRVLRALYALGRADASLVGALSRLAGLDAEIKPLTQEELDRLITEVTTQGDPDRGEAVFRRADLNCMGCHTVANAGGDIGPDLSALGSSSPIDYIVNAVMQPDQAVKEQYQALVVLTYEGQIFQGIVADQDDQRLVLKEATGERRVLAKADIEDQKSGGTLMPQGLPNLMTHSEFVDLVRFLSELGKPGPFAISGARTIQRWRVLRHVPEDLARSDTDHATIRTRVIGAGPDSWISGLSRVSGDLPLEDLVVRVGGPILYLQADVEVGRAGVVSFRPRSLDGLHAWIDDQPVEAADGSYSAELESGLHTLTLRVDTTARDPLVRVEVLRPEGSSVELTVGTSQRNGP